MPDPQYPVDIFEVPGPGDDGPVLCAIISVLDVEGRLLVAVPHKSWSRTTKNRVLPPTALSKATLVEVPFEDRSSEISDPGRRKIWLGLLASDFERYVNFETAVESSTLDFPFAAESPFVLPVADSLAEHAFQFTPFESAASGGAGGDTVEQRLGVFEKSLADIAESLKRMAPSSTTSTRPSALRATPKPASKSAKDQTGRGPQELQSTPLASRVESFDLEVVRSAREAGVPDSQIARMLDIAAKAGRCAPSSPQGQHTVRQRGGRGRGCRGGGASCSNRWQQQGFGFCRVKAHQDCSAACFPPKEGSESRRSARRCWFGSKRQQWSRWLTSSCSSPTSIESSFGEATRRAVQGAGSKSRAGLQCGEPSSWQCFSSSDRQGLLEMRSHVQNFQTPARLLWGVAGALDCMRLQKLVLG